MKKGMLVLPVLLCSLVLFGHEFWLHPDKFYYQPGETINIRFKVGENFDGENWTGNQSKVQNLQLYFNNVNDSCTKHLGSQKGDSLQLAITDEGTAMLAFHSTNTFIELEAEKFNEYLAEDGLENVLDHRTKNNELKKPGKEYYQRCAKTIIQVGNKTSNNYKKETGMVLDIIPKENPYTRAKDGDFKVMILFHQKPLKNAMVKVWHRLKNKITTQNLYTDEEGEVKFFMGTLGAWMVSTVQMEPIQDDSKADWQSYWGSLTWGYTK